MHKLRKSEISVLSSRVTTEAPAPGTTVPAAKLSTFAQLPLSQRTLQGLGESSYTNLTDIQRMAIPHALAGRDILGAAKTGSGKTLAFLIPLLETLYRHEWGPMDGLGALVLTPTRELALQIFDVLRAIGKKHTFSAGLVIGGKDFTSESERIATMNILVGTPGRVLQHLDQSPLFSAQNLRVLVLDEADRCLDMGFESQLNAIVDHCSRDRQTLLFSATQTRSVKDLARLSLKHPEYISTVSVEEVKTPAALQQFAMTVPLDRKVDILFQFVKTHAQTKMIIFASTAKMTTYLADVLTKLKSGAKVMTLTGKMKQMKRLSVFKTFCSMQHGLLLCTDLAARGLDMPSVDWVVQFDCPESVATYIHRVGRTARYTSSGKALLFLCPSEMTFLQRLADAKVPVEEKKINPNQLLLSTEQKLAGFCVQDSDFRVLTEKALSSSVKALHRMSDKEVFAITDYDFEALSKTMGLHKMPKIKVLKEAQYRNLKERRNLPYALQEELDKEDERARRKKEKKEKKAAAAAAEDVSDDELMVIKRKDHEVEQDTEELQDGKRKRGQKKVFGEDGQEVSLFERLSGGKVVDEKEIAAYEGLVRKKREQADVEDREREKERVRRKHRKQKGIVSDDEDDKSEEEDSEGMSAEDSDVEDRESESDDGEDDDEDDGEEEEEQEDDDEDEEEEEEEKEEEEEDERPQPKKRRVDNMEQAALRKLGLL